MAFGWSAGDILTAINFVFEIAQALDEVDGAAKEFREASTFLKDLKSALVPLQIFTVLDTKPEYKQEIEQQVLEIKIPVERFMHDVRDLREDLGVVREGHFRHLQNIPSKFKWHFRVSKKAVELQNKVEQHLKIIEALMQRLIVDMLHTLHTNLQGDVGKTLEDRLNIHLSALQAKLLAELDRREIASKASWQTQFENIFESYLGSQQVNSQPSPETTNSLHEGQTSEAGDSVTSIESKSRLHYDMINECPWPFMGICADPEVTNAIYMWWQNEYRKLMWIQEQPPNNNISIASQMVALAHAGKGLVAAYSFRKRSFSRPIDQLIDLTYSLIWRFCEWNPQLSKSKLPKPDGTKDCLPGTLAFLRDLISQHQRRCLIVIERIDILEYVVNIELKTLFGVLQGRHMKIFETTFDHSSLLADQVAMVDYIDAIQSTDFSGFYSLEDFKAAYLLDEDI